MSMIGNMFKTPKVQDYNKSIAEGQKLAGLQTAEALKTSTGSQAASNIGQVNPYGTLKYEQTDTGPGGVPLYTAYTDLAPEQQRLHDIYTATQQLAGTAGQNLMGFGQYDKDPASVIGGMESGITKDILDRYRGYITPFQESEKANLEASLLNKGLMPGTPAYDNAMRKLTTDQNLANSRYAADTQAQAFGQAKDLWSAPAAMAQSLAGFGKATMPKGEFTQGAGLDWKPGNIIAAAGNIHEAAMDKYKADLAQQEAALSGLFGLGSAALGGWAGAGFPAASTMVKKVGGFFA